MKRKYLLFPFLSADYRAAEAWLNEQAAKGLRLVKLSAIPSISIWEETDDPRRYAVALWPIDGQVVGVPPELNRDFDDFTAFAEGVGWRYVGCRDLMRVFEAEPGTDPAPLYTDPETELSIYRGLVVRRARRSGIVALCACAFLGLVLFASASLYQVLARNLALAFLVGVGTAALLGSGLTAYFGLRLKRDRQAAREGRALFVSPPRRAYWLGMSYLGLGLLFTLLLTGCALADYFYCPWQSNGIVFVFVMATQAVFALLGRRKKGYVAAVIVLVVLIAASSTYSWTHQPKEYLTRYRSPVLAYQDHYVLNGYGFAVRRNHYESKLDWMTDGIYDSIRKKEALADMPPPDGFRRMAAERAEDGKYDTLLLTWEGNAVLLESVGMKGPLSLETMLGCALREPGED